MIIKRYKYKCSIDIWVPGEIATYRYNNFARVYNKLSKEIRNGEFWDYTYLEYRSYATTKFIINLYTNLEDTDKWEEYILNLLDNNTIINSEVKKDKSYEVRYYVEFFDCKEYYIKHEEQDNNVDKEE